MSHWFTSDLHLGHANIIRFCKRPFDDVGRMDAWLIDAINDRVTESDDLWVLGDFAHRVSATAVRRYRERICCRHVHLIRGNHDRRVGTDAAPFEQVLDYYDGLWTDAPKRRVVLFHYPMLSWSGSYHGSYHLQGHIHADRSYNLRMREEGTLRYDVGVDANGYAPVSLADVVSFFGDGSGRGQGEGS